MVPQVVDRLVTLILEFHSVVGQVAADSSYLSAATFRHIVVCRSLTRLKIISVYIYIIPFALSIFWIASFRFPKEQQKFISTRSRSLFKSGNIYLLLPYASAFTCTFVFQYGFENTICAFVSFYCIWFVVVVVF